MPGEEDYARDPENIHLTFSAANQEITVHIAKTGSEDADTKYLNKGSLGSGINIRPDVTVELLQLGSKVFRNPIVITTVGLNWVRNIRDFNIFVLRATAAGEAKVIIT